MLATYPTTPSEVTDQELRRQIDRSVSRALVDAGYRRSLLADPTVLLEERGCSPQQYLHLRSIHADNLTDFARQAEELFWLNRQARYQEDQLPLAAAAAR